MKKHIIFTLFILICLMQQHIYAEDFWKEISSKDQFITSMAEDSKGNLYYTCTGAIPGIYQSTDNGETWQYIGLNLNDQYHINMKIDKDDIIYLGLNNPPLDTNYGTILRSDDYGNTWKNINNGLSKDYRFEGGVYGFTFSKEGNVYAITDIYGVIKSTNKGENWTKLGLTNDIWFGQFNRGTIDCNNNNLFIISCTSSISTYDEKKDTFRLVLSDTLHNPWGPDVFDISINSKDWIFASTYYDSTIFSTDNGNSWQGFIYEGECFSSFLIKTDAQDNIYVVKFYPTEPRTYRFLKSIDNGLTWINMNYNIPDSIDLRNMLISSKGYIFLASANSFKYEGKIYRSSAPVVNVEENNPMSDLTVSPNPATDYIEISVGAQLAVSDQSEVKIYDVYGQTMSTPVCSADTPASGGQRIDVSGLAPGMYFVRIGDRVSKFIKM